MEKRAEEHRLDLDVAICELTKDGKRKDLGTAKRRYLDSLSGETDLRIAKYRFDLALSYMAAPPEKGRVQQESAESNIAGALIDSAIIIYAKVVTVNDARGELSISNGGGAEFAEAHRRLLDIRNKAIGHHGGYDDPIDGVWAHDRLFFKLRTSGESEIGYEFRRANYKESVINDLALCLDNAQLKISQMISKRGKDLVSKLEELSEDEVNIIAGYPFRDGVANSVGFPNAQGDPPAVTLYKAKPRP